MQIKKTQLKKNLNKVEHELIGLWKFRVAGKVPLWCTTFAFNGCYYDTYGKKTPEAALEAMHKTLEKLRKKELKKRHAKN